MIQYIQDARDEPAYAVLPIATYERLRERAEMFEDVASFDVANAEIAASAPVLPAVLADRLLGGEILIRIWREYHGVTQTALTEAASVNPSYVSQIERGHREAMVGPPALRQGVGLPPRRSCGLTLMPADTPVPNPC